MIAQTPPGKFAFTILMSFIASTIASADDFTSGTHDIDGNIDGIHATGPGTVVTIRDPAYVSDLPDGYRSAIIEDGARATVHGGTFTGNFDTHQIHGTLPAAIDIFGGQFERHVGVSGTINIYGGEFRGDVLLGNGVMNVYGGSFFERLGYDSGDNGQVNVYGRKFDIDPSQVEVIESAFGVQFPLDQPGETFSMRDGQNHVQGLRMMGEFPDGSPLAFSISLDGIGNVNLIVVPEPSAMLALCLACGSLFVHRRRTLRARNA